MSIINSFRQRGAKWHSTVVLALLIGPLNALPASAAPYQIIDLGTDVAPADINNQGTVVGSRRTDMGNIAFRWSAATGIEDIVGATAAHAVNELGQITGTTLSGAFLFDGTLQGIHRTDKPAFSFQGHPEASPGPHDAAPLFDHFIELIEARARNAA